MAREQAACSPVKRAGTVVHVAVDGTYAGYILITDTVKPGAKEAIARLKSLGVQKVVMLTGDSESVAREVAQEVGVDEVHASLLPDGKVAQVERLLDARQKGETLAFVGDGINDAPVLARADVGIAMGAMGADAAIEAADVVLMDDDLRKLADAIRISRATHRIVRENIVFSLAVKALIMVLAIVGMDSLWCSRTSGYAFWRFSTPCAQCIWRGSKRTPWVAPRSHAHEWRARNSLIPIKMKIDQYKA